MVTKSVLQGPSAVVMLGDVSQRLGSAMAVMTVATTGTNGIVVEKARKSVLQGPSFAVIPGVVSQRLGSAMALMTVATTGTKSIVVEEEPSRHLLPTSPVAGLNGASGPNATLDVMQVFGIETGPASARMENVKEKVQSGKNALMMDVSLKQAVDAALGSSKDACTELWAGRMPTKEPGHGKRNYLLQDLLYVEGHWSDHVT